jgi:DNA-binding LacI/PurR family transcriptional regulator
VSAPDQDQAPRLLYERLYQHVLEQLRAGQLGPGDRVPSEMQLAERFGVSRVTSRRALEALERAHVVVRIRGKGTYVADPLPDLDVAPASARSGRQPRVGVRSIGLLMPDISESYGLEMMLSIEERSAEAGYQLLLRRSRGRREAEDGGIDGFLDAGVDGLIVFPVHGEYHNRRLLRLVVDGFPLVVVDRHLQGVAACAVHTDNRSATRELTAFLLGQGYDDVAFLSPPPTHTSSIEDRLEGYRFAIAERGLGPERQHLLTNLYSTLPGSFTRPEIQADEESISKFVEQRSHVRAFVACEYNIALVLADVLRKRWPAGTYEIACFDSPADPFGHAAFTHIEQDQRAIGRTAVDLLSAQLAGQEVPPRTIVPHRLVKRADAESDTESEPDRISRARPAIKPPGPE